MIERGKLVSYLNDFLRINDISDKSVNGLQVGGRDRIERVALATDASLATYKAAITQKCDLLLVHHGIIWGGLGPIVGRIRQHLKILLDNDLNLYAAHLPLDLHPEVGNNAQLAKMIGLHCVRPFGQYGGVSIGYGGQLQKPVSIEQLSQHCWAELDCTATLLKFGPKKIQQIAIVSGSGASALDEAAAAGYDCLITGEGSHDRYHQAKELGIHVIYLGHYKSETMGVQALGAKIESVFDGLTTTFIDLPTGF